MRGCSARIVRSPIVDPDLRSPSGFDSGLSPSAQDDTESRFYAHFKQWRPYLLTGNAETNESLLQWEKVAARG